MNGRAVVAGAGGFIGHHIVSFLKREGYWVRGVDIKEPEYDRDRGRRVPRRGPPRMGRVRARHRGRRRGVSARRRHGRHRLHHRVPRGHRAEQRPDQRPHARGGDQSGCASVLLLLVGVHLSDVQAARSRGDPAARKPTRIPPTPRRGTGGRSSTPRSSASTTTRRASCRRGSPGSTTSTVRSARTRAAGRRRRRPSRARSRSRPTATRSRSGATASRRGRSRTSTTASKGIHRIMRSEHAQPLNLGSDRSITVDGLVDLVSEVGGQAPREEARHRRSPKAFVVGTATTPHARAASDGSQGRARGRPRRDVPMDRGPGRRFASRGRVRARLGRMSG